MTLVKFLLVLPGALLVTIALTSEKNEESGTLAVSYPLMGLFFISIFVNLIYGLFT